MDGRPEISGGFIATRRNCSELFEGTEEILDAVARLIEFAVKFKRVQAVWPGWDTAVAGGCQWLADPFVGIEGAVGDQPIGLHFWQQCIRADQNMRLSPASG